MAATVGNPCIQACGCADETNGILVYCLNGMCVGKSQLPCACLTPAPVTWTLHLRRNACQTT